MKLIRKNRVGSGQAGSNTRQPLSYYRTGATQRPKQGRASQTLPLRLKYLMAWFTKRLTLVLTLAAAIFWGLSSKPVPKLTVGSLQYRPLSSYSQIVSQHVNKLRDSNKFTYDAASITNSLTSAFPEVNAANLELPLVGRQPIIRLNIAKPELRLSTSSKSSAVIAANGRVVKPENPFKQFESLPEITDQSGLSIQPGYQLFSGQQISFLGYINDQLESRHLKIDHYVLPLKAQEVDLFVVGQNYFAKFNLAGDEAGEVGSFLATRHYLQSHHIRPSQYVDVRVDGKVFYK